MIRLGQTYSDKITGFEGVATGYVQYISGCNQVLLSPTVSGDGDMIEPQWIDEQRLKESMVPAIELDNGSSPGFSNPAPKR